jgi:hypothetical protein
MYMSIEQLKSTLDEANRIHTDEVQTTAARAKKELEPITGISISSATFATQAIRGLFEHIRRQLADVQINEIIDHATAAHAIYESVAGTGPDATTLDGALEASDISIATADEAREEATNLLSFINSAEAGVMANLASHLDSIAHQGTVVSRILDSAAEWSQHAVEASQGYVNRATGDN